MKTEVGIGKGVLEFEKALAKSWEGRFVLRLYLTGTSPKSLRAIKAVKSLCEQHLNGRYDLEVIDLYQQPELAKSDQIIAVPTLVKKLPFPLRRLIGDLSDPDRVLIALDLKEEEKKTCRSQKT
jgi:circadian clock protein KaiB